MNVNVLDFKIFQTKIMKFDRLVGVAMSNFGVVSIRRGIVRLMMNYFNGYL